MTNSTPTPSQPGSPDPQEPLTDAVVLKFLEVLERARAEDMSCDDLFTQLDEFVEREVSKKDAAKLMPLLDEHLDICSHCCDEYEALLAVLENAEEENKTTD